ncbi:unnamed protein product [Mytilus coruscus]|uniref:DNA-directed DNA polymerase n=1 Tax=Mytilus coruscus TaxID=42192 RepID=A0A6J8CAF3_MYTCO|nr:unnamed protein product [Mytilus coruscus]
MSVETETQFQNATNCYVCNQPFSGKIIKVRDHDHLGMNEDNESPNYSIYRGAACHRCNLMLKYPNFIPVYFHNLPNFDAHLLLSEAGKFKDKKLTCIPNNMEKYVSFSVGQLRFLDTYQCMSSSLETLIANLAADGFKNFKQFHSLCYEILTDDVYEDMKPIKDLFDTSKYGSFNKTKHLFSNKYKKVVGKFKDELGGVPLKEFVGLRPKMYSLLYNQTSKEGITCEKEKKVAKGISKTEIKQTLRHEMYKKCLNEETTTTNSMTCIRSKNHELFMDTIVKKDCAVLMINVTGRTQLKAMPMDTIR